MGVLILGGAVWIVVVAGAVVVVGAVRMGVNVVVGAVRTGVSVVVVGAV
jgi:hypothetical protein